MLAFCRRHLDSTPKANRNFRVVAGALMVLLLSFGLVNLYVTSKGKTKRTSLPEVVQMV